ncbi:MAG: ribonuclease HI [Neisseria sp.]|nr:ribonuclease HI [Neisseria sp.]
MQENTDKTVYLYTDGACKGNPGTGGWGVLLRYGRHEKELFGGEAQTTNNRMELTAVIEGLRALKRPSRIEIHTDSQYVKNGMESWISGWKKNGWRTAAKQPVKNEDLWRELDRLAAGHDIVWRWVKGHAGHTDNERADALANLGAAAAASPP